MLLKELKLRNFGLYRGEQVFDFEPRVDSGKARPIILVGGQNGAGKTTLLEAVRLCLYGRVALGNRVTDTEYHAYLRDRIHKGRDILIPVTYASVALEFEFSHAGKRSTYQVQRAWEPRGATGAAEYLRVLCNGQELAEIESQFWPEFVRSLVPPGISQLFFFDGEKIKRLAEEESEVETLAESIKALLGLDLIERLQADLDLYGSRFLRKTATASVAIRLAEIESQERQLKKDLEELRHEEEGVRLRNREVAQLINGAEQQLAQCGEGLSAMRGELHERKAQLLAEQDHLEKAMRELCDGPLPFALCPNLAKSFVSQLVAEVERERWEKSRGQIKKALATVQSRLTKGKVARALKFNEKTRAALETELTNISQEFLELPAKLEKITRVHDLSDRERDNVQQTLEAALQGVPRRAVDLAKQLNQVAAQLRQAQERLNRAPDSDEMAPMVRQLSTLQEEHASLCLDLKLKAEQREQLDRDLSTVVRERERIMKAEEEAKTITARLALALSARRALDDYLSRLTAAKVEQLQAVALGCFRQLSRKTDLVHGLTIDPKSFSVSLYDAQGQVIPKPSLSAGEKQIYAISLLWALAKVSGRALPMIIDTPLGRLDSVHRQHLLERYFPIASHQVIILSTDTEVDQQYFDQLKPHTSHAIHLSNDSGWTEAAPGYFWGEAVNAGAAA